MDTQKRDLCRLCLESINGFDELLLNSHRHLIQSILVITGIEVVTDATQCEYLCSQCHSFLEQCDEFRWTCRYNNIIFREMMTVSIYFNDRPTELKTPVVEYIKRESVDLGYSADDVNREPENKFMVTPAVESSVEKEKNPKKSDDDTNLHKHRKDSNCNLKPIQENHNPNRKKMICSHCSKDFLCMDSLKQHIDSHHTRKIRYTCDQCGKSYRSRNSLNEHHTVAHNNEKRSAPKVRGEKITRSSMRSNHPTQRPFVCDYCDKTFTTLRVLFHHTCLHKRKKKHATTQRSVKRTRKSNANQNDGAKPLTVMKKGRKQFVQCQQCDKVVRPKTLVEHQKTHSSNRRKSSCPYCLKGYLYAKDLQEHIAASHSEGIHYNCDQCGRSYATRRSHGVAQG